jgi:lipopolysaccharide/colanic/teichoic acid biosynthesis glycosyltransferase
MSLAAHSLTGRPAHRLGLYKGAKRAIDLAVASMVLVAAAPVMLVCAVLVRTSSPGPVLFRQRRVGRNGVEFEMLKFRSMYQNADDRMHREQAKRELAGEATVGSNGSHKDDRDPRITPIGRVLRRYSLDELPQLINVACGEMSLVGPRPSLPYEVAEFPVWALARHEVRPGLTGLWQVSGRCRLSMIEMLQLDCSYIDTWTLSTDLRILARTPHAVLAGEGAA